MHKNTKTATNSLLTALALSLALVATTSAVHGAGFAIYENDARGFAMGGANAGKSDDAAALYSNPAGITQLPGLQIKAGFSLIQPSVDVTTYGHMEFTPGLVNGQPGLVPGIVGSEATDTSMNNYTEVVPHLYATYRINDDMAVGLAVFVPYGLKSDFSSNWVGAYNNYYTSIETVEIAPTFAYRLVHDQPWAKQISVAAGIAITNIAADIRKRVAIGATETIPQLSNPYTQSMQLGLSGDSWEYGYNFAIQWEVNDQIGFGIVYRSGFKVKITGADVKRDGTTVASNAWGKLELPESWTFGVNYSPVAPLNIGFQATRTNWSAYDTLTINAGAAYGGEIPYPKEWSDVWRYSIGAEYQLNNALALRGGFVVDKDPVNTAHADYMVPSNDRQIFSAGLGWTISNNVTLDFAAAYLKIKSARFNGRADDKVLETNMHTGHALIFSVSASFRF
ncbi:MAG: OmpP1/FadL family transporter [Opitutaceae bacterium]|nr:OmpP1/FadL family transporter [Opitutaceae bacterium]